MSNLDRYHLFVFLFFFTIQMFYFQRAYDVNIHVSLVLINYDIQKLHIDVIENGES